MSELLIKPFTVTSVRKLLKLATVPLCALVWLISELLTEPLAVVSPRSTPIVAGSGSGKPFTPDKPTVTYWPLVTPVRFTVHWFELGPLVTVPAPLETLALPQLVTGSANVNTIV